MELLRKEDIRIMPMKDGIHVAVALYKHQGVRWWIKYHLSDLPNDFVSRDDLERFGINAVDKFTCGS